MAAIRLGDVAGDEFLASRWLIQHCSVPLLSKNARGETCAHLAALHGNLKCLQTILAQPASPAKTLAATTIVEQTPTVAGNRPCAEVLVQKSSANLTSASSLSSLPTGATPVFYAAQEGHLDVLRYLVEEVEGSLDLVACEGMTPLLSAAEGGHLDVIKYILKKQGHRALFATTKDGATAFHYAAGGAIGDVRVLSVLLLVQTRSAAVYRALGNGRAGVLKYLLETQERRELLGVADLYDRTPAHDAAENGHVECLQLLVETGDGETAMSLAMRSSNTKCVLFARAVAETALEKCSTKSFKKKLGSRLHHISSIMTVRAMGRDQAKASKGRGVFDCSKFPFRSKFRNV
ncbi:hypothetical protein C0Q70_00877 [Pomacea canaliculata]|uniref:SOCS box domain-containing protein n=1 Tax=Pomacea canaliculata TaxID=400727 RepID=A0A2T7PXW2_POMCA|nr:hypothetical protein C0Q70_00877 [Pomacea canaliculata]